jgi:hypothetical protein
MRTRGISIRSATAIAVVAAVSAALPGCGTLGQTPGRLGESATETVQRHPETVVGAGAGAAGGAVIGGLAGGSKGAVIGGLLGALAGGAVGNYVERRETDSGGVVGGPLPASPAATLVRIDRADPAPPLVSPGGTVHLNATYTIAAPGDQAILVRETREVRYGGELVANPTTEVQRVDGTYTTDVPITLPVAAKAGRYEVTTTVAMGDRRSSQTSSFEVVQ